MARVFFTAHLRKHQPSEPVDVAAGTVREALEDVFDEQPELRGYILDDQCRVPLDARVVVSRTPDGGNTFEVFGRGLPDHDACDIVFRHAMDVDPLGKSLAMGSTTGGFWVSENSGEAWQCMSQSLPPCLRGSLWRGILTIGRAGREPRAEKCRRDIFQRRQAQSQPARGSQNNDLRRSIVIALMRRRGPSI